MGTNLRKRIKDKIKNSRNHLTLERLSHCLRTDLRAVKKTVYGMKQRGEIRTTTIEDMLEMGK